MPAIPHMARISNLELRIADFDFAKSNTSKIVDGGFEPRITNLALRIGNYGVRITNVELRVSNVIFGGFPDARENRY